MTQGYPSQSKMRPSLGGISGWFNSLLGRNMSTRQVTKQVEAQLKIPQQQSSEIPAENQGEETEDSVSQDIKTAKKIVSGVVKGISQKVEPVAQQKIEKASKSGIFKKLLKIILILFFLSILIFIGLSFYRTLGKDGNGNGGVTISPEDKVTPTPYVYNPYKPSIYAVDPEILTLEEDITLLEKEIFRAIIREDKLFPPVLDFKVEFK